MNTPAQESMFTITLSQQGATDMLRVYRISRWIFAIVSIFCVLFMITAIMRYANFRKYEVNGSMLSFLELRVFPLYWFFCSVLAIFQVYYFFRFTASCKKAIELGQTEVFNDSMKWLIRNVSIGSLLCVLDLISAIYYLYIEWDIVISPLPAA
jgi:CDP-diglyceride synthetase